MCRILRASRIFVAPSHAAIKAAREEVLALGCSQQSRHLIASSVTLASTPLQAAKFLKQPISCFDNGAWMCFLTPSFADRGYGDLAFSFKGYNVRMFRAWLSICCANTRMIMKWQFMKQLNTQCANLLSAE